MLREIEKWIVIPANALAFICGLLVLVMMVHVTLDIGGKLLFQAPVDGTIEIVAAYYMVAVIYLPLAYVSGGEGHIRVDLFTQGLKGRALATLKGITGLATAAYMAVLVWFTGVAAVAKTEQGELWETAEDLIEVWPSRWFLPIGCGVMLLFVIYYTVVDWRDALGANHGSGHKEDTSHSAD